MKAYQGKLAELEASDTQVLGVTMDTPSKTKTFAGNAALTFPLLLDRDGKVTRKYGIYDPHKKAARRVTFLIDKRGKIIARQIDTEAMDPDAIVQACKRQKLKE